MYTVTVIGLLAPDRQARPHRREAWPDEPQGGLKINIIITQIIIMIIIQIIQVITVAMVTVIVISIVLSIVIVT